MCATICKSPTAVISATFWWMSPICPPPVTPCPIPSAIPMAVMAPSSGVSRSAWMVAAPTCLPIHLLAPSGSARLRHPRRSSTAPEVRHHPEPDDTYLHLERGPSHYCRWSLLLRTPGGYQSGFHQPTRLQHGSHPGSTFLHSWQSPGCWQILLACPCHQQVRCDRVVGARCGS